MSSKKLFTGILQYILMFLIVLYGQTVWICIDFSPEVYFRIEVAVSIITFILIMIDGRIVVSAVRKGLLLVAYLLVFLFLTKMIGYRIVIFSIAVPMLFFIIYLSSLYMSDVRKIITFAEKYSTIVTILAAISLVMYLFGTVLKIIPSGTEVYTWAKQVRTSKHYFHLMYETQSEIFFGRSFIRNCGIFCEAPSYAVPLILSLFFEMIVSPKMKMHRIVILITTIVTSFSTKALIIVFILFAIKYFDYIYVQNKIKVWNNKLIFRSILPLVVIIASFIILQLIDQKSEGMTEGYLYRLDDIIASLRAFRNHWLVGVGVKNEAAISRYSSLVFKQGYSVGLTVMLAEGGLVLGFFYLMGFINSIVNCNPKVRYKYIYLEIVLVSLLFTSNIPYFLSVVFILSLQYSVMPTDQPTG